MYKRQVEGHDTCRKIAILTSMATGKEVDYQDIYTEGITRLTDIDFKYAEKLQTSVKLLGTSRMQNGKVNDFVAPVMIAKENPLYSCLLYTSDVDKRQVNYIEAASNVARVVSEKEADFGVVCCGTGMGVSIVANKHKGVYCALVESEWAAHEARNLNDANVIAMGNRIVAPAMA